MAKLIDLEYAARVLRRLPENPRIVISGNLATPMAIVEQIDQQLETATLHLLNAVRPMPRRAGITLETAFVGPGMRGADTLRYVPARLSMVPVLLQHAMRPDAVILHTSTPRGNAVSLGIEVNILPAAIEAVRAYGGVVIALANPRMPYTLGDSLIDLSDLDYIVDYDEEIVTHEPKEIDSTARQIGKLISDQVRDGSTLQLGIGAVPDAVLDSITFAHGLRIWSETISDGVLKLERAGALDPDIPVLTSFMNGSDDLYAWADNNPRLSMMRTERSNSPFLISKHFGMTSINAALQVDLHGQANASRVNNRIYSGIGGSTDFIIGALHARRGQAFIALPSWHPKVDRSTVVAELNGPVTSFQQSAIATEQGIAWLFGASEREQAEHLISKAAHPDARAELREAASRMKLA